ncbi:ATP-binding protein [Sphaerisporangium corydalis]|uniref:ATP-binding protein n=2 Tax=Sphaerisporangium corydalis TaxID=1441875 RepID=A0ABV9EHK2_9ACTN
MASFPASPEQVSKVRAFMRVTLGDSCFKAVVEDAELLATELVTNSIRYSRSREGGEVHVVITVDGEVRVKVIDDGPDASVPVVGALGPLDVSGRGLMLVQALASRFGVRLGERSTTTWFELDL